MLIKLTINDLERVNFKWTVKHKSLCHAVTVFNPVPYVDDAMRA
jgi:hypothetical protein